MARLVIPALALSALVTAPIQAAPIQAARGDDLAASEELASAVTGLLKAVDEAFRTTGDPFGGAPGDSFLADEARATSPSAETAAGARVSIPLGDGRRELVVAEFEPPGGRDAAVDPGSGREDAVDDVRAIFGRVERELGGRPTRAAEIKAKRVVRADGIPGAAWELRFRVRHVRHAPGDRAASLTSYWTLLVEVLRDRPRVLAWRAAPSVGVSIAPDPEPVSFVDVAGTLLRGERARWLAPSIMDLRDTLDVDVGVGILGHHGVAVADANGDGIEDLYVCQPGGIPNQLWLRQRDGTAVESAAAGGLDLVDATTSALFVDLDGDGDRDVVLGLGGGVLVLARTDAGYREAGRFERTGVTSLAAADVDGDRRVDLYACAYANPYDGSTFPVPYHDAENGQANLFLANRTEAADELRLVERTEAAGLDDAGARFSFAATFEDFDDDGDVDLYVANDFGRNALYVNDGAGVFTNRAAELGVEDVAAGMGAAFAELDGDGVADLYVANMESSAGRRVTGREVFRRDVDDATRDLLRRHAKGNTLFLGSRDGAFRETGEATAGQWAWGAIPIDLDADGRLDLYVPNGFVTGTGKAPDL